ncbi:MAG: flagellar biosynthetic protein FliR [Bdellovibrionota bacterium]
MGNLFQYNETQLLAFVLVMVRMGIFLGLWPVLGTNNIPKNLKVILALVVSMVIFPLVGWQQIATQIDSNMIIWLVAKEVGVGMVLVFMTHLIFQTVQVCGEIVSVSMGLSSAQTLNPVSGSRESIISQFQLLLVSVFFLTINGHHVFFSGLMQSYELVPLGEDAISLISGKDLAHILQLVCEIGLKLSAPVLAAMFFSNIAMAIIGRAVPQINILITSFPVNILLGFVILIVTVPAFLYGFKSSIDIVMDDLFTVLKSM